MVIGRDRCSCKAMMTEWGVAYLVADDSLASEHGIVRGMDPVHVIDFLHEKLTKVIHQIASIFAMSCSRTTFLY